MNVLRKFIRLLRSHPGYTPREVEEAEVENILQDNAKAFQEVSEVREKSDQANNRLAKAVERVRNPFAELEDLMSLRPNGNDERVGISYDAHDSKRCGW